MTLAPGMTQAKALYVNNSGSPTCSDATTYTANSSGTPWCTIGRAAWGSTNPNSPNASQAALAGDTVYITSGTYTTGSIRTTCATNGWAVALNPANSGTGSAPITFQGVGTVNINLASGYAGATIGVDKRNYIVWDNVRLNETVAVGQSCADTGPAVFHETTGSKLLNSSITGRQHDWNDNYNGVRVEAAIGVIIANNSIYNITQATGHNAAGVMIYDTSNSIFEHNLVYGSNTGFYIKGDHRIAQWPQRNNIFRFNWVENCSAKGFLTVAGAGSRIYQNIVKNASIGMRIDTWDQQSVDITIANNTFIATAGGYGDNGVGYSTGSSYQYLNGIRVFNNIFFGPWSETINMGDMSSIGDQTVEHNVYFGFDNFGSLNGARISYATWKSTHNKDNAPPAGLNANPLFVDSIQYKLLASSPARGIGVDILDLDANGSSANIIPAGAYITGSEVIGTAAGFVPPPAPPPPRPFSRRQLT